MVKKTKRGGMNKQYKWDEEQLNEFKELEEKTLNILLGMDIDQKLHRLHITMMEDEVKNAKNKEKELLEKKINESKVSLLRKEGITKDMKKELEEIRIIIEKKKILLGKK